MHLNKFFRVKCNTFISCVTYTIDNVVHAFTLVCMYVCIVPNVNVLWAGGLEN
jgi:hypothetical protein